MAKKRTPPPSGPHLHAHIVLDRSGSMAPSRMETISSVNAYLQELPEGSKVSLTLFDQLGENNIDRIWDRVDPKTEELTAREYMPRGNTPLYDAIGEVLKRMERETGRIALVIVTDGHENSSRHFTKEMISGLLATKQQEHDWLVIYLGANQDAWNEGSKFGTIYGNTMSYDMGNIRSTMSVAGNKTADYFAGASAASVNFTDEERDAAIKK